MIAMPVSDNLIFELYRQVPQAGLYLKLNYKAYLLLNDKKDPTLRSAVIIFEEPKYHSLFKLKYSEHL